MTKDSGLDIIDKLSRKEISYNRTKKTKQCKRMNTQAKAKKRNFSEESGVSLKTIKWKKLFN